MRSIYPRFFAMLVVFLAAYGQCFSADTNVEVLYGKVKTILDKKSISVFLIDKDGSILDIASLDKQGGYKMDPTVMDDPSYNELSKLKIRIKDKKGRTKEVQISKNIDEFLDKKVKLGALIFP